MTQRDANAQLIAVLLPCYNEGRAIAQTVANFRAALPSATIYVYDNNSTDDTAEVARGAGAIVRHERAQGKGNVVRRMFADVDADIYIMSDGDDTYDSGSAPAMVARLIGEDLDMITGVRRESAREAYRRGHRFGNWMLTSLVAWIFDAKVGDMLSGYRVMSRRFVKTFPTKASGFGIETEMTVHALELRVPQAEHDTIYKERPEGSVSKLKTFRDGFRILFLIVTLTKEERPLWFFGLVALAFLMAAIALAVPIFLTYFETGLVPRLPTAILAVGLGIVAFLSFTVGLVLDTVTRGRWEAKRLAYLRFGPPGAGRGAG